ncbi:MULTISPECIES: hypothetical protein [unclassified Psychrobacillus]|uniref:hypothetical protein n=1 Tax=unclassified Psychrobacillus TaxID=2636677 RepID=UPI0030FA3739
MRKKQLIITNEEFEKKILKALWLQGMLLFASVGMTITVIGFMFDYYYLGAYFLFVSFLSYREMGRLRDERKAYQLNQLQELTGLHQEKMFLAEVDEKIERYEVPIDANEQEIENLYVTPYRKWPVRYQEKGEN